MYATYFCIQLGSYKKKFKLPWTFPTLHYSINFFKKTWSEQSVKDKSLINIQELQLDMPHSLQLKSSSFSGMV